MPLTPTERKSLALINAPLTANNAPTYHVVLFRGKDCRKHTAGQVYGYALTECECRVESTKSVAYADQIAAKANNERLVFAMGQKQDAISEGTWALIRTTRKNEGVIRVSDTKVVDDSDDVVADYGDDGVAFTPIETAEGWGLREGKDGLIESFRTTYTLKSARTGERDLYAETAKSPSLMHKDYADDKDSAGTWLTQRITFLQRVPAIGYIVFGNDVANTPEWSCKYCGVTSHRDDNDYIGPDCLGDKDFLVAAMSHYYECKRIASFKKRDQYAANEQAWALQSYGIGVAFNTKPVYSNIARDLDGNVTHVSVEFGGPRSAAWYEEFFTRATSDEPKTRPSA